MVRARELTYIIGIVTRNSLYKIQININMIDTSKDPMCVNLVLYKKQL